MDQNKHSLKVGGESDDVNWYDGFFTRYIVTICTYFSDNIISKDKEIMDGSIIYYYQ